MAPAEQRTHYQVLGVAPGASAEEIRRAHRQLARVLHPDRLASAGEGERALAERRMREVNVAWTALSDPTRRADYDRALAGATRRTSSAARSGPSTAARDEPGTRSARPEDADDPDLAYARARAAQLDPDEAELSPAHFWLLRRGPVVALVLLGLVLFVVTAYAGNGSSTSTSDGSDVTVSTLDTLACVRNVEGRTSVWVGCQTPNDGRVVTFVDQPLDCPERTSYVVINSKIACVTTDPTLMSDVPPTTRD